MEQKGNSKFNETYEHSVANKIAPKSSRFEYRFVIFHESTEFLVHRSSKYKYGANYLQKKGDFVAFCDTGNGARKNCDLINQHKNHARLCAGKFRLAYRACFNHR